METFASMKNTVKLKNYSKVAQFSTQSDIFGKIFLVEQNRTIDLKDVFCFLLGLVPWAFGTSNDKLMKTSKSQLICMRLRKVSLLRSVFHTLFFHIRWVGLSSNVQVYWLYLKRVCRWSIKIYISKKVWIKPYRYRV